jgi:hypothetical protein
MPFGIERKREEEEKGGSHAIGAADSRPSFEHIWFPSYYFACFYICVCPTPNGRILD